VKIYASKQLGPVYYMVKELSILESIVKQEVIKISEKPERGYSQQDKSPHHYVSFLRSLDKAGRNPRNWVYGVRLDGNKLTNKYKISPYSQPGNTIGYKSSHLRVSYISEYDDGTYMVQLIERPSFFVPENIYRDIEKAILNDVEGINEKKNLVELTGKRSYRGKTVVKKYFYNTKNGGIHISDSTVSPETISYLVNHKLNETEERYWVLDSKTQYIDISGCIIGYIEPKGDDSVEQAIDAGKLPPKNIWHY